MHILSGICLVSIGILVMIYGSRSVTPPQSGGIITKLFSGAHRPGGVLANKVISWILGLIVIGLGLSLVVQAFSS